MSAGTIILAIADRSSIRIVMSPIGSMEAGVAYVHRSCHPTLGTYGPRRAEALSVGVVSIALAASVQVSFRHVPARTGQEEDAREGAL